MLFAVLLAAVLGAHEPAVACPVTAPPVPAFVPSPPYPATPPNGGFFWFGTAGLWTMLPASGRSIARDKSFWWHPGFDGAREPRPDLRIAATSLETGLVALMGPASNASHPSFGGSTMLTMVEFPSGGCWRVTASYAGHSVSYVTDVVP